MKHILDALDDALLAIHILVDNHVAKVRRELKAMTERNNRSIGQLTRIRRKKQ